ncbi:LysR family transcriptional regulator [Phenylobacterium sp.]|uniref:LysR family transcriptional regulator n=1 Tax=Phenylobacterium sp. TaxID=1871053 RepID=UPI0035B2E81E
MDDLSLDQLRVFVAVAEEGSFSAAARAQGRAQSAVTYAIQRLEAQAGVALFDRTAYRPVLTEAGRALLPRACQILEAVGAFRAQAQGMTAGLEAQLSLVVEAMFPMSRLVAALSDLQARFPSVQTRVQVESLGATRDAVLDGRADIGLILSTDADVAGLRLAPVTQIELVAVAAPTHPLAAERQPLAPEVLREHLQLVLSDRSVRGDDPDRGVIGRRTWRLGDLGAKHAMLLAGLGWGSLPAHMIEDDLASGRLVRLAPAMWDGSTRLPRVPVVVAHAADRTLGTAGRWLFERLSAPPAVFPSAGAHG